RSSTLNVDQPGQTVANLALVALGRHGAVAVHAQATTHVVLDVVGYVLAVDEASAVTAGRYEPQSPFRVLDTRTGVGAPPGAAPAGGRLHVVLPGVPADASAVVVNLTATGATSEGFVQALPPGSGAVGQSSNLNVVVGRTVANLAVVPVVDG